MKLVAVALLARTVRAHAHTYVNIVNGRCQQADDDGHQTGDEEQEDGEVEVVEVLDDGGPVVGHAV